MNIVFFGSSDFSLPALKTLLNTTHQILCVVTQADRPSGRGLHLSSTVIKTIASKSNLKIYQPQNINSPETMQFLKGLNVDLFVVIAYGQILSSEVLAIPRIFCINIHASNLPKYRGAAPINWAIMNGEKTTAVSIIKMTEYMDAGPIIIQKSIEIKDDDTYITLAERLSRTASDLLVVTLKLIEEDDYKLTTQDERLVSFAPQLKKKDGLILWEKSAEEIHNLIRGLLGWPGAFTYYNGKLLKIYKSAIYTCINTYSKEIPVKDVPLPGEIIRVSRDGIVVACKKGNLIIKELQLEAKRKMTAADFIAGNKILLGEVLGKK